MMFDPIKELARAIPVVIYQSQDLFTRLDFRNVDREFVGEFIADLIEVENAITTANLAYSNAEAVILRLLKSQSNDAMERPSTQIGFAVLRARYFVRKVRWILVDHFGIEQIEAIPNEWPIDCRNAAALTVRLQKLCHDQDGKPSELWPCDFEQFSRMAMDESSLLMKSTGNAPEEWVLLIDVQKASDVSRQATSQWVKKLDPRYKKKVGRNLLVEINALRALGHPNLKF